MTDRANPRAQAMASLMSIEKNGRYPNIEVDVSLKGSEGMTDADRGLYTRLVYGVTERKLTLDWIISRFSKRPVAELDLDVVTALRLGIYQLAYMDRIPEYSAVDETVGLLPKNRRGYVNAVLRGFIRAGRPADLPAGNTPGELSVRHSVSEKLALRLLSAYGDETDRLLGAMGALPGKNAAGLRVNTLKITPEEALDLLPGSRLSDLAGKVVLVDGIGREAREGLERGLWFVQDPASAAAASAVGARPGEFVIDTCACPGGKSFYMAMDMDNRGRILSLDIHGNKLSLIEKEAGKLGISIIGTGQRDGRDPLPELFGKADRVLCDAPCSGIGVMGKKPDIRYKDPDQFARLPEIQKAILDGASRYVREHGTLVYSTCTVFPEENGDVVGDFLEKHPGFRCVCSRQFLPHTDGCDGFYYAILERTD